MSDTHLKLAELNTLSPLNAALAYADLGWHVFPCFGKRPAVQHGLNEATTDRNQIWGWWRKMPWANIGIATGAKSGIVVLDVDLKGDGFASLERLTGSRSIDTLGATTGGGGKHFVFLHPGRKVKTNASVLAPGLDIRGDGGYIVASPSAHESGVRYRWSDLLSIAEMPEWISPAVSQLQVPVATQSKPFTASKVHEGGRNAALASRAGLLRKSGLSRELIEEGLLELNASLCQPPLDEDEVRAVAKSISRYEPDPFESEPDSNEPFPLTDVGNAERLVSRFGTEVRYVNDVGKWYLYDGMRWKPEDRGQMIEKAKETAKSIYGEAQACKDSGLSRETGAWAMKSQDSFRIKNMVELAKSDPVVSTTIEAFDQNAFLLNVANGTVDLRTGKLLQHRPENQLMKLTDVSFDSKADCPRWKLFLNEVMLGDPKMVTYLQKIAGYSLTGDTREQVFFICHGSGSNGKSVFLEILSRLVGDYGKTTDFSTFLQQQNRGPRADLASLVGARLVCGSEIGIGDHLDETVVKQVTGSDRIAVRQLYKDFFTFTPQFKLFLATNHKPRIRGTENGIWRRVKIIPWLATFTDDRIDPQLIEKLQAEMPGILNWAVEGCLKWQSEGLGTPPAVRKAINEYMSESDQIRLFVEEWCVCDPKAKTSASDLFRAYSEWCEHSEVQPVSNTFFGTRMTEMGFERKSGRTVTRLGIRPKLDHERVETIAEPDQDVEGVEGFDSFRQSKSYKPYIEEVCRKPSEPSKPSHQADPLWYLTLDA